MVDSPGDSSIRRYLAEALGLGGMGCCLRSAFRPEESEPLYRRTIEIRRELLCRTSPKGAAGASVQTDIAGEVDDLSYLVSTVHLVAGMLDGKRKNAEAEGLRRQLKDDIAVIADRFSGPEFQTRRHNWAQQLLAAPYAMLDANGRRDTVMNYELALVLDPENADAHNDLAWALVSVPGDPWFDPARGLSLAQKAVALEPNDWRFLNTLGVAAFRARDWKTAANVLQQSVFYSGGAAHDLFFLAMTYHQEGNKNEARALYERAIAWTEKNRPSDPELRRFRAEAGALLGEPCPEPSASRNPPRRMRARAEVSTQSRPE